MKCEIEAEFGNVFWC